MKKILVFLFLAGIFLSGCSPYEVLPIPENQKNSMISDTYPLSDQAKQVIEGVYTVSDGSGRFGSDVVLKFNRVGLAIDCSNGNYACLETGQMDSVIFLEGYWRYAFGTDTGPMGAHISKEEGGREIVSGKLPPQIVIRGGFGSKPGQLDKSLVLTYSRPFSEKATSTNLIILANYGGGRNSDDLPVSENSINMLRFTQRFGSMGVEIDIHVSKDGVPFLYHDSDINIRLCQKGPLQGNIDSYTWDQLQTYVRLIHGEKIPSLEDALNFIIDSTGMSFVWLDMKVSNDAASKVIPLQMAALSRAKSIGRNLQVVYGCPSEEVITDFMSYPGYADIPSLCELSLDDVSKINGHVWGVRWTEGLQDAGLQQVHSDGRIAITWTLDEVYWIQKFINETTFDGILTNYPCLVAYYHYIR
jgi:glycerophosphoryl diester phosphodiesterase